LPFFYDSCSNEKKPENISADSAAVVIPVDTLIEDSILQNNNSTDSTKLISIDTTVLEPTNQKDEFLSETIIKKSPILKLILTPNKNTYTGLATIINTIPFVSLFASTITLLLLLIGLLSKLIDKKAIKIFLILEICAATFLFIASPYMIFDYEILWVYWMCMVCIIVLILIDAYILYKQKRKEK
jgi:uncharacterized membrane protein